MLGGGYVEIQFLQYTNAESKTSSRWCCDVICFAACDNRFQICYREYNFSKSSQCSQQKVTSTWSDDSIIFSSGQNALGNGVSNPFTFRFEHQWLVRINQLISLQLFPPVSIYCLLIITYFRCLLIIRFHK